MELKSIMLHVNIYNIDTLEQTGRIFGCFLLQGVRATSLAVHIIQKITVMVMRVPGSGAPNNIKQEHDVTYNNH